MLNLNNLNNLGALGVKGASLFDPSQIKVDGEKILTQQLLTRTLPTQEGLFMMKGRTREVRELCR